MLLQQGSEEKFFKKHLRISWKINSICNFKCSYCFDPTKTDLFFPNEENINTLIDNIMNSNHETFEFIILGGEPLLYPNIVRLLKKLCSLEKVTRVFIITNGSIPEILDKVVHIDSNKLKICFSIHPEVTDEKIFSSILETINDVSDKWIHFSLMYLPKYRGKLLEMYDRITKQDKAFMLLRKPPEFVDLISYKEDDLSFVNDKLTYGIIGEDVKWKFENETRTYNDHTYLLLNKDELLNFQGMYCLKNSVSISVNPKGHYRGLNCDVAEWSRKSLYKKMKLKLEPTPVICPKKYCSCVGNITVLKFKDKSKVENFCKLWK